MLRIVWEFIKNPTYQEDSNTDLKYRFFVFIKLLLYALAIGLLLGGFIGFLETVFEPDLGKHASERLFEKYTMPVIFLLAVVAAPLVEELVFRGPLIWFRKSSNFKYVLYILTLAFGAVHLSNFESVTNVLWISPILIAPQICLGFFLAFVRVRFGLLWAILLHAAYNLVLTAPLFLLDSLNIPLE